MCVCGMQLTHVRDGVVVQDQGAVRQETAEVEVYVTIPRFLGQAQARRYLIAAQNVEAALHVIARGVNSSQWLTSLYWRANELKRAFTRNARSRRGAFDFVGDVGSSLFGIATADDVEKVASAVEQLHDQQTVIIEHQNKLIGAIRQLGEIAERHAAMLERLEQQMDQIKTSFLVLSGLSEIGGVIGVLEVIRMDLDLANVKAHERVILCQTGTVSEAIIPDEFFTKLVRMGQYGSSLTKEWYLGNLMVAKYFDYNDYVICKVNIPLVAQEDFLSKKIYTYAVPQGDVITRILHDTWIALGSQSGKLFYPGDDCVGKDPTVCKSGMIFHAGQEQCVRGMISGDPDQKAQCPIQISTIEPTHRLLTTGRNAFVVYTKETALTERCDETEPTSRQVMEGLYILQIEGHCSVESDEWRLEGVQYVQESVGSLTNEDLEFPQFVITTNWTDGWRQHLDKHGDQEVKILRPDLELPPTIIPKDITVWHPKHVNQALVITGVVVVMLAIAAFVYCCCCGCPTCKKKKKADSDVVRYVAADETVHLPTTNV